MDRRLRYHPLFECDVLEAASWYDRRSPGLGDAFINMARSGVAKIVSNPDRFALAEGGCRYVRLERFPYVILFDVVDDEVLFLGVLHTARSMEKWRERQRSY
jgi:hypothetical protein